MKNMENHHKSPRTKPCPTLFVHAQSLQSCFFFSQLIFCLIHFLYLQGWQQDSTLMVIQERWISLQNLLIHFLTETWKNGLKVWTLSSEKNSAAQKIWIVCCISKRCLYLYFVTGYSLMWILLLYRFLYINHLTFMTCAFSVDF